MRRALAGIARADRFPGVDAQGSLNRNRTPADLSPTGRARTSSRYDLGLGITAFELDFWGRVTALNEAALAQYLASEEAAKSFRVSLIGDVANTWYQMTELAERERLASETLGSRKESLELIRKRRDAGLATELEVLAAESLAESVRGQWTELKRQRMQAAIAPGLPSQVLLQRPNVRGAARAAFFPRISLTGSFGTASSDLSGLFDSGSGAWLFNPVLKWPLFDAGAPRPISIWPRRAR
jgi:multidrug efflux system outer membrane protein